MKELAWRIIAKIVSTEPVVNWLIKRAKKTPYKPIIKRGQVYMDRFWLFNRYDRPGGARFKCLPSVRIHHIQLHDDDRHLHSHPWIARTIILRGGYVEWIHKFKGIQRIYARNSGLTQSIGKDHIHAIRKVSKGGCWTLFITWRKEQEWGFLVDGKIVPHNEYLTQNKD